MPLRYGLVKNQLTEDPDDCMAIVQDNETFNEDQIVDRMISRGSTVTKAEALSVLEEYGLAQEEILKGGNNINTKLFCIYPSIAGVFNNSNDSFDPSRHAIRLNVSVGSRFAKVTESIATQKISTIAPGPVLQTFTDLKTKKVNVSFTPGQIASIIGVALKFNEEDVRQGIFFVAPDKTETHVTHLTKNKPSELQFFIPESLTTGTYQLEVRTIMPRNKKLTVGRLMASLVPVI